MPSLLNRFALPGTCAIVVVVGSLGVHAAQEHVHPVDTAAVIKAARKKDQELVDAVYSGVPAGLVGREQEVDVGPMSGRSNVVFWLERRGLQATDEIVDRIFAAAKASDSVLSEETIRSLIDPH